MSKKRIRYSFLCVSFAALLAVSSLLFLSHGRGLRVTGERVNNSFRLLEPLSIKGPQAEVQCRYSSLCVSRAFPVEEGVVGLEETGVLFNSTSISTLCRIRVSFEEEGFSGASLYLGNHPYPHSDAISLSLENDINIEDAEYFLIQSTSSALIIREIEVFYYCDSQYAPAKLPTVHIDTQNEDGVALPIDSKIDYTGAKISVDYPDGTYADLDSVSAGVRIRGNSTAGKPKKPYRIKFDKKQSLFGLTKNKNWALLADWLDPSKMKNYMALEFSSLVRGENEFTGHPNHVEVYLNGAYQGLYLLVENMDEEKGRLALEENDGFFVSLFDEEGDFDLNDFPFAYERDESAPGDGKSILDETYFSFALPDESLVYYSLNYPEKEDFTVLDENGKIVLDEMNNPVIDEEKYFRFFEAWKAYVQDMEAEFYSIQEDTSLESISSLIDVKSFASMGLVDLFMAELDHRTKSAKFYKPKNGFLHAGPAWDYDSCSLQIAYSDVPVDKPNYEQGMKNALNDMNFGETHSKALLQNVYGKAAFAEIWRSIPSENVHAFAAKIEKELSHIGEALLRDERQWYQNSSMVYNNLRYAVDWSKLRLKALGQWFGVA